MSSLSQVEAGGQPGDDDDDSQEISPAEDSIQDSIGKKTPSSVSKSNSLEKSSLEKTKPTPPKLTKPIVSS